MTIAPSLASFGCAAPNEIVSLPGPVALRLGVGTPATRAEHLRAAVDRLAGLPARQAQSDGAREVVYQAFLGPFLGFRGETGTLCSLACHLPFLIEELGATTVILLPILQRGVARRKGATGSPFAVSDHRRLDQRMSGFADHLPVERVWQALVGACGRAGVRLGMIVPLATVSIDSELIADSPALVHWWTAQPSEILTGTALDGSTPGRPSWHVEATPAAEGADRFAPPPSPERVVRSLCGRDVLYTAVADSGEPLAVANAYPDPVVADAGTYSWEDVAAVRFSDEVAPTPYRDLTSPHRAPNPAASAFVREVLVSRLAADGGVLLADVSSAVPAELLADCVPAYPETMLVAEQLWEFRDRAPFAFVTGPLIPCVAAHTRAPAVVAESLAYHLRLLARTADAAWFFAGVANHDSLPCPARWARALLTVFCLLPRSVPFLFSGTEFGSEIPTNLEFGELGGTARPSERDLLLFSQRPVVVEDDRLIDFSRFWRDLLTLRAALGTAFAETSSIRVVAASGSVVSAEIGDAVVVTNCDPDSRCGIVVDGLSGRDDLRAVSTDSFRADGCDVELSPASTVVLAPTARLAGIGDSFVTEQGVPLA